MKAPHQEVTDRILAELETGTAPWIKPWSETPGRNVPCNAVTGRPYSGVNVLLLWLARDRGWPTPRFLTFNQARADGGHVRIGEHGSTVYFVKDLVVDAKDGAEEDDSHHVRMLKTFTVFNIAQCDELPTKITEPPTIKPRHNDARDVVVEEFIRTVGVNIVEVGARAHYIPTLDRIEIPPFGAFTSAAFFYGVMFHELTHWTGHTNRLDRDRALLTRFKTPEKSKAAEELVAELGNAFLAAEFSIDGYSGHARYIESWIQLLKDDPKAIFTAASKAQEAVDYLRNLILAAPAQAAE